ncbi:MAG: hypothetical protein A2W61_04290 [Deltaproteobacteria bacterium RIFCSPLOWO2_01_44_7]|nr:MAG: hypothetical protein A2712_03425 [Deltaproteobacteria bacterium RIFCSPHIGHO2_01_FULL_43_49]OGQ16244.1 MAG: hypothetical protein A3D22_01395 [Deltaproteobacteria bacterium RIFCSPHIGHO2_02_FULL_44_53]OGQ29204.1 MAG: hypothetical protein A3D98_05180 [Deltaproteobacteria bacterium RIFCSPHIGHO2_12_FULL_44_21]OGQ32761.1 MAG: hypothetical protein A2979_09325 [Deltaproteobacteria bacterium RIFCSPLOWO2_01_FULL_45_74]OGQ41863.1 MAG: hypothetical protein A3I70_09110 [Deltaproteobacteria bacterium 
MPLKNLKKFQDRLEKAAKEKSLAKRGVKIAAVIADALRTVGEDPILVGGTAVEFYTEGGYATQDIDMVTPGGPSLFEVMMNLGFERRGKDFIHEELEIYIEFPGVSLGGERQSDLLDVDGTPLLIISIEDLIVDRLCAYKFWKSGIDGLAALLLLESRKVDEKRLKTQAKREEVEDALDWVEAVYEKVVREKMKKEEASRKLEKWLRKN